MQAGPATWSATTSAAANNAAAARSGRADASLWGPQQASSEPPPRWRDLQPYTLAQRHPTPREEPLLPQYYVNSLLFVLSRLPTSFPRPPPLYAALSAILERDARLYNPKTLLHVLHVSSLLPAVPRGHVHGAMAAAAAALPRMSTPQRLAVARLLPRLGVVPDQRVKDKVQYALRQCVGLMECGDVVATCGSLWGLMPVDFNLVCDLQEAVEKLLPREGLLDGEDLVACYAGGRGGLWRGPWGGWRVVGGGLRGTGVGGACGGDSFSWMLGFLAD